MKPFGTLRCHPEIKLLYVLVTGQFVSIAFQHQPAALKNVAVISDRQCLGGVLLHKKYSRTVGVNAADHTEYLGYQQWGKTQARLIEHDEPGLAHDCARDREHLLLPAGHGPGLLGSPLSQTRKHVEYAVEVRSNSRPVRAVKSTQSQILTD